MLRLEAVRDLIDKTLRSLEEGTTMTKEEMFMDELAYYAAQSPITDPGREAKLLVDLPATIPALCGVVQGLYVHYQGAERYGYKIPPERLLEVDLRYVELMLARIVELDDRPLVAARPPERRLVGCCRDAATLLCALARHQGIPTRVRFGFAAYFKDPEPGFLPSHVIAEFWDARQSRWRLADPELDEAAVQEHGIGFDVCDVPRDAFLTAGEAWHRCRAGAVDPDRFGVYSGGSMRGLPFVRGNLIEDLAAQNKIELLCWDAWGLMLRGMGALSDAELELLDRAAALTEAGSDSLPQVRAFYEADPRLKVPSSVVCYSPVGPTSEVTLRV